MLGYIRWLPGMLSAAQPVKLHHSHSQWKWRVFSIREDLWLFPRSSLIAILPLPLANEVELERINGQPRCVDADTTEAERNSGHFFAFADVSAGYKKMLA
jgi:hypothetical protein